MPICESCGREYFEGCMDYNPYWPRHFCWRPECKPASKPFTEDELMEDKREQGSHTQEDREATLWHLRKGRVV